MRCTLLVARREFIENLKTKTFWIGILAFPVILTLSILVPTLLDKHKDVRRYAVLDRTPEQWMTRAVEDSSAGPDLVRIFKEIVERARLGDEDALAEFPESMRSRASELSALSEEELEGVAAALALGAEQIGSLPPAALDMLLQMIPEDQRAQVIRLAGEMKDIKAWWSSLPPAEARRLSTGLSRGRYERADLDAAATEEDLAQRVDDGDLFAYFVIPEDPVSTPGGGKYVSNNLTDEGLRRWFSRHVNKIVKQRRFEKSGIDAARAQEILAPVVFRARKVEKGGKEADVKAQDQLHQWLPVVFVYLLWISVWTVAQMLLTNTVEEKSNRIIEVLLSSISPSQLMAGKIIGIAATGLTVISTWVFFAFLGIEYGPGLFGTQLPFDLGFVFQDPVYIGSFVAYFLMGYLLYAAVLVGLGSVCNSLKEAQNLMMPIVVVLLVPLLAMIPVGQDPNGALARLLSYIPPFTPFVMMNRAAAPPPFIDYVLTTILLVVSIVIATWGAAKVFRIGILMTGKPPRFREIIGWLRAPVGPSAARKD